MCIRDRDITLQTARDTSAEEINRVLRQAAESGPLRGLLAYTELPHASCDFNHDPHSAIVDGSQTRVSGPRLVNLLAWFDNEWGFANRMLDVAEHFLLQANQANPQVSELERDKAKTGEEAQFTRCK